MLSVEQALSIIETHRRVAVVGLSPKPYRASYDVARFLQSRAYQIIPIHPHAREVLGQKVLTSLEGVKPDEVDWIDIFLHPKRLESLVGPILRLKPKLVWCQLGVVNEAFNQAMEAAQIPFIVNQCPKILLSWR